MYDDVFDQRININYQCTNIKMYDDVLYMY